jgi:hypothetical protein
VQGIVAAGVQLCLVWQAWHNATTNIAELARLCTSLAEMEYCDIIMPFTAFNGCLDGMQWFCDCYP